MSTLLRVIKTSGNDIYKTRLGVVQGAKHQGCHSTHVYHLSEMIQNQTYLSLRNLDCLSVRVTSKRIVLLTAMSQTHGRFGLKWRWSGLLQPTVRGIYPAAYSQEQTGEGKISATKCLFTASHGPWAFLCTSYSVCIRKLYVNKISAGFEFLQKIFPSLVLTIFLSSPFLPFEPLRNGCTLSRNSRKIIIEV